MKMIKSMKQYERKNLMSHFHRIQSFHNIDVASVKIMQYHENHLFKYRFLCVGLIIKKLNGHRATELKSNLN